MYKVSNNFPSAHMNELSEVRHEHPYNLRQNPHFSWLLVKSVYYKAESLSYLQPEIYSRYLDCLILYIDGLDKFKKAIKNGNLKIVLEEFVRSTFQMSILYRKQCLNYLLAKYYWLYINFSSDMILNKGNRCYNLHLFLFFRQLF